MNTNSVSLRWYYLFGLYLPQGQDYEAWEYLQHASWIAMCPSRQYSSTIYLGDMVQRDKTTIFDNINEM